MIFKVSFKETDKNPSRIVEKKGRTTTVTLKGTVKLPGFWSKIPDEVMEWIATNPYVELYEDISNNTLLVFSEGRARLMEGDKYDTVFGERLAEARAKYDVYRFFYRLSLRLHDYYSKIIFGNPTEVECGEGSCLAQDVRKYVGLCIRESQHIGELLAGKENG